MLDFSQPVSTTFTVATIAVILTLTLAGAMLVKRAKKRE